MTDQLLNFFAGPGKMPAAVLERIRSELTDFDGLGLSVMEISHRSQPIEALIARVQDKIKNLLGLDQEDEVLLMQGGGTLQFFLVPMNLSGLHEAVDYVDTGYWTQKAIAASQELDRDTAVIAANHDAIPSAVQPRDHAKYLHICSNNTVVGTQWHQFPDVQVPLVADMSSDFLSRRLDFSQFDLLYAHAQKTIGTAGVTIVAIKKHLLNSIDRDIPQYFDYRVHAKAKSNYQTPPIFAIYVVDCMLDWIEHEMGGLDRLEQVNQEKANTLYDMIDSLELFTCPVEKSSRSMMNIVFEFTQTDFSEAFFRQVDQQGILGLKGHRSRGGLRASLYNAVTLDDVRMLADFLRDFEKQFG